MKTITLYKKDVYKGFLILVNHQHPLQFTCQRKQLSTVPNLLHFPLVVLDKVVANILSTILIDLNADRDISLVSGYRSLQEQKTIYQKSLKENGEEFTQRFVALPNHSEHQTGYAIDLALQQPNIDFICPDFPDEGICQAFKMIAPAYGFIQRYPKEKEAITSIDHEPWHFRYVGYPHALIMQEESICLEEYIEKIKGYPINQPYVYSDQACLIEIFYVPALLEEQKIKLNSPLYQVSGNNIDGFIITLWRKKDGD